MTIASIAYNEARCDHIGCTATLRVWEGCDWRGWKVQDEGYPWKFENGRGNGGGYRTCHYCPEHAPLHPPNLVL